MWNAPRGSRWASPSSRPASAAVPTTAISVSWTAILLACDRPCTSVTTTIGCRSGRAHGVLEAGAGPRAAARGVPRGARDGRPVRDARPHGAGVPVVLWRRRSVPASRSAAAAGRMVRRVRAARERRRRRAVPPNPDRGGAGVASRSGRQAYRRRDGYRDGTADAAGTRGRGSRHGRALRAGGGRKCAVRAVRHDGWALARGGDRGGAARAARSGPIARARRGGERRPGFHRRGERRRPGGALADAGAAGG